MKKVLVVAYQFPPMGGSGVQRTAKFVKYLRHFGFEPVVFTRSVRGMKLKDESLLSDIPDDVSVIRTPARDFTELEGLMSYPGKFVGRKLLIPDSEVLWQLSGRSAAVKAVREHGVHLVYTTSYPYSDHLMGLHLKRSFPGLPWVADFRDEWTNNPYLLDNPHNRLRMSVEKKLERKVLYNADRLITNTPVMLRNFLEKNGGLEDRFSVIPNGYDEEDFTDLPREEPSNERFTLTYTGLLYGRRKPDVVFEAVKRLIAENRIDAKKIEIRLIGNYKFEQLSNTINTFGLGEIVKVFSYMQHGECLRRLTGSDALLLLEATGPGAEAFYTGKIFEYMNTGRPILAVIPSKGAAAGLIRATRSGRISDYSDVNAVMENLLLLYEEWNNRSAPFSPDWGEIRKFERKTLTGELAGVFREALKNAGNA